MLSAMAHSLADEDDPELSPRDDPPDATTPSPARRLLDAFVASSGSKGGGRERESGLAPFSTPGGLVGRVLFGGDDVKENEAEEEEGDSPGAFSQALNLAFAYTEPLGMVFRVRYFPRPDTAIVIDDDERDEHRRRRVHISRRDKRKRPSATARCGTLPTKDRRSWAVAAERAGGARDDGRNDARLVAGRRSSGRIIVFARQVSCNTTGFDYFLTAY
jgi:hypothetical protein